MQLSYNSYSCSAIAAAEAKAMAIPEGKHHMGVIFTATLLLML